MRRFSISNLFFINNVYLSIRSWSAAGTVSLQLKDVSSNFLIYISEMGTNFPFWLHNQPWAALKAAPREAESVEGSKSNSSSTSQQHLENLLTRVWPNPLTLTVEGLFSHVITQVIVIIFQFSDSIEQCNSMLKRTVSRPIWMSLFTWFLDSIDVAPKNRSNNCQDMIICRCSSSCNNLFGWRRHSKSLGMSSHGE